MQIFPSKHFLKILSADFKWHEYKTNGNVCGHKNFCYACILFKSSFTCKSRIWQAFTVIKYGNFFQISKNGLKNTDTVLQAFKRKKDHTLEISYNCDIKQCNKMVA